MPDWPGPLFHPTAGSIAVMRGGTRITAGKFQTVDDAKAAAIRKRGEG